jgi:hypothetical protein
MGAFRKEKKHGGLNGRASKLLKEGHRALFAQPLQPAGGVIGSLRYQPPSRARASKECHDSGRYTCLSLPSGEGSQESSRWLLSRTLPSSLVEHGQSRTLGLD